MGGPVANTLQAWSYPPPHTHTHKHSLRAVNYNIRRCFVEEGIIWLRNVESQQTTWCPLYGLLYGIVTKLVQSLEVSRITTYTVSAMDVMSRYWLQRTGQEVGIPHF